MLHLILRLFGFRFAEEATYGSEEALLDIIASYLLFLLFYLILFRIQSGQEMPPQPTKKQIERERKLKMRAINYWNNIADQEDENVKMQERVKWCQGTGLHIGSYHAKKKKKA